MNNRPVAVITGASRGIGRSIVLALVQEGFDIAAIARTPDSEGMLSIQSEVEKLGGNIFPIGLDISATALHNEAIESIMNRYGRIDLLVNNAGVAPLERKDILEMTEESYDRVIDINLKGPVFFAQRVAREMIWLKNNYTELRLSIIFITSVSSYMSSTNKMEYCVSKAGLSMASTIFADRLAEDGIAVYEVRPGIIKTDMTSKVKDRWDKLIAEGLIPQKRWGTPDDVSRAVVSLARGDWPFSTGAIFEVSGGMNIRSL